MKTNSSNNLRDLEQFLKHGETARPKKKGRKKKSKSNKTRRKNTH